MTRSFVGHAAAVMNVQWSPHTLNTFASGGCDSTVVIWNTQSAHAVYKTSGASAPLRAAYAPSNKPVVPPVGVCVCVCVSVPVHLFFFEFNGML